MSPLAKHPSVLAPADRRATFDGLSKMHLVDLAFSLGARLASGSEESVMAILRRESDVVRDMRVGEFGRDLSIADLERQAHGRRLRAERLERTARSHTPAVFAAGAPVWYRSPTGTEHKAVVLEPIRNANQKGPTRIYLVRVTWADGDGVTDLRTVAVRSREEA